MLNSIAIICFRNQTNKGAIMNKTSKNEAVRCHVTVRTEVSSFSYHAIFPSTCDALLAALDMYGRAHVSVRAMK